MAPNKNLEKNRFNTVMRLLRGSVTDWGRGGGYCVDIRVYINTKIFVRNRRNTLYIQNGYKMTYGISYLHKDNIFW